MEGTKIKTVSYLEHFISFQNIFHFIWLGFSILKFMDTLRDGMWWHELTFCCNKFVRWFSNLASSLV